MRLLVAFLLICAPALAADAPYITSITTGTILVKSNFTGYLGYKITTASTSISVTSLGRYCLTGNSASHLLVISNGTSVVASATVSMTGCTVGTYVYSAATVTLAASTVYYVLSAELSGGDTWYDFDLPVTGTAVAVVNNSTFNTTVPPANPAAFTQNAPGSKAYVPVNFKYTTANASQTYIF